jgi:hypothetical protein
VVDAFLVASRDGDLHGLLAVLDPAVVLRGDGGAPRSATPVEVRGAEQVARRAQSFSRLGLVRLPVLVNGAAGLRARLIVAREPSASLPFVPLDPPRIQIVRCGPPDPKADSSLPPLAVHDWLAVEGGFLVGYNSGEWGGGVLWYDSNGTLRQTITRENAVRFVETRYGLMAFTGLAHLTQDAGHVLHLVYTGRSWRSRALDLPGSPRAIRLDSDGSVLVVTARHLVRVLEGSRVARLHTGRWGGLSPTSIEEDVDGALYIGMRSVVARLRPTLRGYTEEWLAPYEVKAADPDTGTSSDATR